MNTPMSGSEIRSFLPGVNVITYPQFAQMQSIEEALDCVFLYETKPNYGHWCCVFRRSPDTVEVFDSYGFVPDDELSLINSHFRHSSNQDKPHLLRLLDASPYRVEYNDYVLQGPHTSTCGRHCISRILQKHLSIDDYARRLSLLPYSPDEYVTMLTQKPRASAE